MAMLSAMNSGIAGLKTYGQAMSVIGDNIANVSTTGFKQSRANFQDVMVRSLSTGATGVNSIGFGSEIGSIQALHSQGSFESTESPMDLAIGMLHEEDLFALLEGLRLSIRNLFTVDSCSIVRQGPVDRSLDTRQANLRTQCTIRWVTINAK